LRPHLPRQRQHLLQRRVAVSGPLLGQPLEQVMEAHPFHLFHDFTQGGEIGSQQEANDEICEVGS
jgi:hypothetical protein